MSTDKTLADVHPGGRVRLGDQAERARFEAWGRTEGLPLAQGKLGGYAFEVTAKAWRAWQYLSAQPSPGGQGALDCIGRIEEAIEFRVPHDIYAAVHGELAELKAALAARQPVGQIPAEVLSAISGLAHIAKANVPSLADKHVAVIDAWLHAAPPAQAVDLANVIDQIAQQWDGCSYDAVGETIDVGQAIRAAGKRLIDSQAVGNG